MALTALLCCGAGVAQAASQSRAATEAALPSRPATEAASPGPEMRHDLRNTAFSPILAAYHGEEPWTFVTAGGIFGTPVIGADGTVYVGPRTAPSTCWAPAAGCAGES